MQLWWGNIDCWPKSAKDVTSVSSVETTALLMKCKSGKISVLYIYLKGILEYSLWLGGDMQKKKKKTRVRYDFHQFRMDAGLQQTYLTPKCMKGQVFSACDDAAFTVCTVCYTSVAQSQGRQVCRDSGLERRHPVFSLYSRETKECSLFIFIQMKLELTASAIHCNKWFFKSEGIFSLFKLKLRQKNPQKKLFRFNLNISSILKSTFTIEKSI